MNPEYWIYNIAKTKLSKPLATLVNIQYEHPKILKKHAICLWCWSPN